MKIVPMALACVFVATAAHADRIVVVDRGQVVQEGSFEQLMAVDGHFKRLAERQLG